MKAELRQDAISRWFQRFRLLSIAFGLILLITSFFILTMIEGLGAGILTGFLLLMTVGSLIVILSPLMLRKR